VIPLVIATANAAKLREFRRLLAPSRWQVLSLAEVGYSTTLLEPGVTYAENALAKATAVSEATGLAALGDDSGIEVLALEGWPGPESARWLGPDATDAGRLTALLERVSARCGGDRRARYVAALALVRPDAGPVLAHGSCHGVLVDPRGVNGFGYDPGFLSTDLGVTFAEARDDDKDRVSHRGRAVAALARTELPEMAGPAQWHP